jgi:hypothetical protein
MVGGPISLKNNLLTNSIYELMAMLLSMIESITFNSLMLLVGAKSLE